MEDLGMGGRLPRAAFFDIDGTLVSFETHEMPESTREALRELRRRGVLCFLATGRPRYQLDAELLQGFEGFDGFDGYVTMTGSCLLDREGKIVSECAMDPADVAAVMGQVADGLYDVLAMGRESGFVSSHTPEICEIERLAGLIYEDGDLETALSSPVYQFCAFVPPEREEEIRAVLAHATTMRWSPLFCDVVPEKSGKAVGIATMLARFGLTLEDAIAFGDGGNDEEMLRACGIGVAMGNAAPETQAVADYVTSSVDEDGIARALAHFGLI